MNNEQFGAVLLCKHRRAIHRPVAAGTQIRC
jgi:hypothetical protein